MKRADVPDVGPDTLKQLQDVASGCDVCQRLAQEPSQFRVALPEEDCCFNRLVYIDVMFLEQKAVLHAVDRDTLFSAATALNGQSAADVWDVFMDVWVTPLVGYPDKLHVDAGSQLRSVSFLALLSSSGVKMRPSGVESHNALGAGERYHVYLRQLFKRVRADHPAVPFKMALSMLVWAMNQTAGPRGLSPILLVFGIHPRMPVNAVDLSNHRERCKALVEARVDMAKHVARDRLGRALSSQVPRAAVADISSAMDVLAYREKPVDKWEGPYRVVSCSNKQVWLDVKGKAKMFSIDKVKEYVPPPVSGDDGSTVPAAPPPSDDVVASILDGIIGGDTLVAELGRRTGELREKAYRWAAAELITPGDIFITEVLKAGDPRISSPAIQGARLKEAEGLLRRGAFERVSRSSVPEGATILGGRCVDAFKKVGTDEEMPKSRLVGQGHKDKANPFIVHSASALRQSSTRLLVSTSAVLGYRLFLHDVDQAYLQSKDKLSRDIYLKLRHDDAQLFGLAEGELLKVLLLLHGIPDSGDYWDVTVTAHTEKDLELSSLTGDPSLFVKRNDDSVDGIIGNYVDDFVHGGNERFQELTLKTLNVFEAKPRKWDCFEFVGVTINTKQGEARSFTLSQEKYVDAAAKQALDIDYETFVSVRAGFAWLAHSRPDLCCAINRSAQVTPVSFCKRHVQELNKAIKRAKATSGLTLSYTPLDRETLHLRVYADASFADNDDLSSQIGYVVLLCDSSDSCHVLAYSSKKARRVVRSIMAGEVYAFADAFDAAFIIKHDLEFIYRQHLPLLMLTDSKQTFDVVTRASHTTERRLMIDVAAAREAYKRNEISNVGLVKSEHNVADGLTKPGPCAALEAVLRTGRDTNPVQQWIIRSPASTERSAEGKP